MSVLIINDYDLIAGDTCRVESHGYESLIAARCASRRQIRKHNKTSVSRAEVIAFFQDQQDGKFYPIVKETFPREVEEFLRRASVDAAIKRSLRTSSPSQKRDLQNLKRKRKKQSTDK